ncbi:Glycosyltransferase [Thermoplasmatales archaeon BRNA1]|nr:Glycosyltransferase [Thermoplasmatales archaeon BRNA1]
MKIAIVTDSYHPHMDGVIACVDIMEELLNDGEYSAEIVAPDSGNAADHRPNVHYCKSIKLSTYEGYFVPIFPSHTKRILKNMGADVMHAQGYTLMTLKGVIAAHRLGIPVICTFHTLGGDALQYYSPIKIPKNLGVKLSWIYFRQLSKWIDIIVTPSKDTAEELRANGITKEIRAIPTPVDTNRFKPADGSRIRERHCLQGKRVMVHVGRVSFEKEINRIVEIMPRLDEDIVLLVVGKGPAMEPLKQQAKELGVEDRVVFAGFVPDEELTEYYGAGDICIMASRWETECLTVLHALACGLPVACSDARALRDYMTDGYNGFLFGDSPDDIVEAVNKCFASGTSLKENAMKTLEPYSYEAYKEKMHQLYADAIAMKSAEKE